MKMQESVNFCARVSDLVRKSARKRANKLSTVFGVAFANTKQQSATLAYANRVTWQERGRGDESSITRASLVNENM